MEKALIVVDVQNDFASPEGSLYVHGGENIAAYIRDYIDNNREKYKIIVATKDWHPEHFGQFPHFSNYPDYVDTWPPHCVSWTEGAKFHPNLLDEKAADSYFDGVFFKGQEEAAYSGFEGVRLRTHSNDEALGLEKVTLNDFLFENGITQVDVVGLATDYCVKATALDAQKNGYETTVLLDLIAGVGDESAVAALVEMRNSGILVR